MLFYINALILLEMTSCINLSPIMRTDRAQEPDRSLLASKGLRSEYSALRMSWNKAALGWMEGLRTRIWILEVFFAQSLPP